MDWSISSIISVYGTLAIAAYGAILSTINAYYQFRTNVIISFYEDELKFLGKSNNEPSSLNMIVTNNGKTNLFISKYGLIQKIGLMQRIGLKTPTIIFEQFVPLYMPPFAPGQPISVGSNSVLPPLKSQVYPINNSDIDTDKINKNRNGDRIKVNGFVISTRKKYIGKSYEIKILPGDIKLKD